MTNSILAVNNLKKFEEKEHAEGVVNLPISSILPRKSGKDGEISDNELWELSYSIRAYGIVSPIIVKPLAMGTYQLIAGQKRIKAASLAGLKTVPCLVYENEKKDNALILMTVIETAKNIKLTLVNEAKMYQEIITQFDLSAEELAKKLGRQTCDIESKIELLALPEFVLEKIDEYSLSVLHGHCFLKISDTALLKKAVNTVCVRRFDASQTESYIDNLLKSEEKTSLSGVFSLKDAKILTNTLSQVAAMLKKIGDESLVKISERDNLTEFVLTVPK